jgi:hypothetical protein
MPERETQQGLRHPMTSRVTQTIDEQIQRVFSLNADQGNLKFGPNKAPTGGTTIHPLWRNASKVESSVTA